MDGGRAPRTLILLTAFAMGVGACGSTDPGDDDEAPAAGAGVSGQATVFAAASLTESFTEIQRGFEEAHPNASIAINFGPSSGLATQIIEQGGADLYASANQAQMQDVVDAGRNAGDPQIFARNELQIIVPAGNPLEISSLDDLSNPDLKVVLAAPQVPVGDYARQSLDQAGVSVSPVSEATDVKGVVGPVVLGEADAGIVYSTDVSAAGDGAEGVDIPADVNVVPTYPIAVIRGAEDNEVARTFLEYVLSEEGRQILGDHGFAAP